jgi:SAM-dependent methyltransferase
MASPQDVRPAKPAPDPLDIPHGTGLPCRICGSQPDRHDRFRIEDYQYLSGRRFNYIGCRDCGCIQIADVPQDLSQFYPDSYYSYTPVGGRRSLYRRFKDVLEKKRNAFEFHGTGILGRMFAAPLPEPALRILARAGSDPETTRILDVGSGSGRFLNFLADEGYRHLVGIDPFLKASTTHANGVRILNRELKDMDGEFDVIMFNYSLEHIPDNLGALRHAHGLLAPGGVIIVDIPTTDSLAFRKYGTHWAQWIAPDHVVLHSLRSFTLTAEAAGLEIKDKLWTSQAAQFWLSENALSGISHKAYKSKWVGFKNRIYRCLSFLPQHFAAMKLNREGQGDTVAYFLKAKSDR